MKKTLMVVDGNSLMHRAFYALPLLTNKEGQYTNAVYGFFSMLINALGAAKPEYLAIAFDMKGKTFRHGMYTEYKAGRKETPEELIPQFDLLKQALRGMSVPVLESEGYEADDILGMLSVLAANRDADSVLLTGDRDALQLISDRCNVMLTRKGVSELALFDKEKLYETYELAPAQIVDLKGFMGDASDHIPGVPGVGEKTALKLLHEYRDMDGVYAHLGDIPGKLREKLADNRELAYLSRTLATIDTAVPIDITLDDLSFGGITAEAARPVFTRLGFSSLQKRLEGTEDAVRPQEAPPVEQVRISDMAALREALRQAGSALCVAVDLEGEISLAFSGDREYALAVEHSLLNMDFTRDMVLDEMRAMLSDARIPKVMHDAKAAITMLRENGIEPKGIVFDTKLAEYVIDPGTNDYSIRALGENIAQRAAPPRSRACTRCSS
jgi:5''-3'' exonuclease (including N-terminal domain of PolI)